MSMFGNVGKWFNRLFVRKGKEHIHEPPPPPSVTEAARKQFGDSMDRVFSGIHGHGFGRPGRRTTTKNIIPRQHLFRV